MAIPFVVDNLLTRDLFAVASVAERCPYSLRLLTCYSQTVLALVWAYQTERCHPLVVLTDWVVDATNLIDDVFVDCRPIWDAHCPTASVESPNMATAAEFYLIAENQPKKKKIRPGSCRRRRRVAAKYKFFRKVKRSFTHLKLCFANHKQSYTSTHLKQ